MDHLTKFSDADIRLSGAQRTHVQNGEAALWRVRDAAKQTFPDHMQVGLALQELQDAALNLSGANGPTGKAYNHAYAALVTDYPGLAGAEKGYASRARWMWNHRDGVEGWWGDLSDDGKAANNHPQTVKRNYEAWVRKQEEGDADEAGAPKQPKPKKPSVADMLAKELDGLKSYIIELEAEIARLTPFEAEAERLKKELAAKAEATREQFRDEFVKAAAANDPDKPPLREPSARRRELDLQGRVEAARILNEALAKKALAKKALAKKAPAKKAQSRRRARTLPLDHKDRPRNRGVSWRKVKVGESFVVRDRTPASVSAAASLAGKTQGPSSRPTPSRNGAVQQMRHHQRN
jgi:hypothetical protein